MSTPHELVTGVSPRLRSGLEDVPERVDLVVVGLGVTGSGVALDAASRGLSVLAVDAHDVAFGTSRWSSKLVHGGLRYLASGQLGIARESARERQVLAGVVAPHLVRRLPFVLPLGPTVGRRRGWVLEAGLRAGDALRVDAGTSARLVPPPRRLGREQTVAAVPDVRRDGLRGGLLSYDCQLEDDVRLTLAVARTAVAYGAHVRTGVRATALLDDRVEVRDPLTGGTGTVRCSAVVNATGVWAGELSPEVRLRPSRGSHLVLRPGAVDTHGHALTIPVPGHGERFCFALPQGDGTTLVGITDEAHVGPTPDVASPTAQERAFLRATLEEALDSPLRPDDVVGAWAGLRPLVDTDGDEGAEGPTADLSRRHAVFTSGGVVTVVGGKLTTYRQMAQDAVDAVLTTGRLPQAGARPCRTAQIPLVGASAGAGLADGDVPERLLRRFGGEAGLVLETAQRATGSGARAVGRPVLPGCPVTLAELVFGVTHEGARDVADLLERRVRATSVDAWATALRPAAEKALEVGGA